jgi:hypothetical protein
MAEVLDLALGTYIPSSGSFAPESSNAKGKGRADAATARALAELGSDVTRIRDKMQYRKAPRPCHIAKVPPEIMTRIFSIARASYAAEKVIEDLVLDETILHGSPYVIIPRVAAKRAQSAHNIRFYRQRS